VTHFLDQRVVDFLPTYRFELRDVAALMRRHLQNVRMFVYLFDEPSSTREEDQTLATTFEIGIVPRTFGPTTSRHSASP
jgi:hypothetical protein